jgi:hypothetical protein
MLPTFSKARHSGKIALQKLAFEARISRLASFRRKPESSGASSAACRKATERRACRVLPLRGKRPLKKVGALDSGLRRNDASFEIFNFVSGMP